MASRTFGISFFASSLTHLPPSLVPSLACTIMKKKPAAAQEQLGDQEQTLKAKYQLLRSKQSVYTCDTAVSLRFEQLLIVWCISGCAPLNTASLQREQPQKQAASAMSIEEAKRILATKVRTGNVDSGTSHNTTDGMTLMVVSIVMSMVVLMDTGSRRSGRKDLGIQATCHLPETPRRSLVLGAVNSGCSRCSAFHLHLHHCRYYCLHCYNSLCFLRSFQLYSSDYIQLSCSCTRAH
jgi:hypothetical protein